MRREDWPERLARYVRERPEDIGSAAWVSGWLAECGGTLQDEVAYTLARRGDVVGFPGGVMAICVGQHAMPAAGPMLRMLDASRAWRVG